MILDVQEIRSKTMTDMIVLSYEYAYTMCNSVAEDGDMFVSMHELILEVK